MPCFESIEPAIRELERSIWVHLLEKLLGSRLKPEALHLEALLVQLLVPMIEFVLNFRELSPFNTLNSLGCFAARLSLLFVDNLTSHRLLVE